MATVTAYAAFDMNAYSFFDILTVPVKGSMEVHYGNGPSLLQIYGTSFTFNGSALNGGTVDAIRYVVDGAAANIIGELGLGGAQVYGFIAANDGQGFLGAAFAGSDELNLSKYSDYANGYAGIDELHGRGGHDTLDGMGGIDLLYGEGGDDVLGGGSAGDFLSGGYGRDTLTGGGGADHFQFDVAPGAAHADVVKGFDRGEHDKIVLDQLVYEAISFDLDLTSVEFRSATDIDATGGALTVDQHILYDSDTGRLYYDADGSGTAEDPLLIARLVGKPDLVVGSFLVQ